MGIYFNQNNKMVFDCRDGTKVMNSNCNPLYSVEYGLLYNWWAANSTSNIAASGWHLPTSTEYNTLCTYLGGSDVAGGKLKETGYDHWLTPNSGATNSVGFNAKGSGVRQLGSFISLQQQCIFMTASDYNSTTYLGGGSLQENDEKLTGVGSLYEKAGGHTIRLLKDSTTLSNGQTSTYTGNDGKVYPTICIGTQEWLAQNLAETKYRDGEPIPEVSDNQTYRYITTSGFTSDAMCAYNNDWSYVGEYGYPGVFDFDGDAYILVRPGSTQDIMGNRRIRWNMWLDQSSGYTSYTKLFCFWPSSGNDVFSVHLDDNQIVVATYYSSSCLKYPLSGYSGSILHCEVKKTGTSIIYFKINEVTQTSSGSGSFGGNTNAWYIGFSDPTLYNASVWNVQVINDDTLTMTNEFVGYPEGNTVDAWQNTKTGHPPNPSITNPNNTGTRNV